MPLIPGQSQINQNETRGEKSRFIFESASTKESDLLIMGMAKLCQKCGLAVRTDYLVNDTCPDCR